MAHYWPKLRLRRGDTVQFDGLLVPIRDRASMDEFFVERPSGIETWHIDKFAELAAEADEITIKREETHA